MPRKILAVMLLVALGAGLLLVKGSAVKANDTVPKKPGKVIQIPRIDNNGGWLTWIQVQNAGDEDTGVVVFFWGEYSGKCPSNDPGPAWHICRTIPENGVVTIRTIPEGAKSAIAYSVTKTTFDLACDLANPNLVPRFSEKPAVNWRKWVEDWEVPGGQIEKGEDLVAVVHRQGPNDFGIQVSSEYVGISENMEGTFPYGYYAPYTMRNYHGLDTEIAIQNSGKFCTAVSIWHREQGYCELKYVEQVETLAPGEAIKVRVPEVSWLGGKDLYLGSAFISANQPLGIVIDMTSLDDPELPSNPGDQDENRGLLCSHRAITFPPAVPDTEVFADLIFREWSGWSASIQVQNLGLSGQPTFVVVDFQDANGTTVAYLGDWVCSGGSRTFYLPAIIDLGRNYFGAAEIYSMRQIGYPGGEIPGQPIGVIVELHKTIGDEGRQTGTYVAHPRHQKEGVETIAAPAVAKENAVGVTSLVGIRNNSNCGKIKVEVEFKLDTGVVVCRLENWIFPKKMWVFDLADIGCIVRGWEGAMKVRVTKVEEICHDEAPALKMPSVVVVNFGEGEGDITSVYDGIPAPGMKP